MPFGDNSDFPWWMPFMITAMFILQPFISIYNAVKGLFKKGS